MCEMFAHISNPFHKEPRCAFPNDKLISHERLTRIRGGHLEFDKRFCHYHHNAVIQENGNSINIFLHT